LTRLFFGRLLVASQLLIFAGALPLSLARAAGDLKGPEHAQMSACQQTCMTEGEKCQRQGSDPSFCSGREKDCTSFCMACIPAFTGCMKVAERVQACQEPFAACLEDKFSEGVSQ
jgi:hypothetical protein